jgi:hypothetical protein
MNFLKYINISLALLGMSLISSCSDKDEPDSPAFIQNAKLKEQGQTLSPGAIVHLEGEGYLDTDKIMLGFYWETGDKLIPEGSIKGYNAKILTQGANGMTIQLPFRKPASRVEVSLVREGRTMDVGMAYLTDGLTPKQFSLYGIVNHNRNDNDQPKQIMRWLNNDNSSSDQKSWSLDEHPDFHSTVGAYRSYGICGLSKTKGNQYPYFFDLLTGEWTQLRELNTIALYSDGNNIFALSQKSDKQYDFVNISSQLERSEDYAVDSRANSPMPDRNFPLPDGVPAESFGDYPGAYDKSGALFSINRGNGKWAPVLFNPTNGFSIGEDIEADALIPFSYTMKSVNGNNQYERFGGYIVVLKEQVNGARSLFYLMEENFSIEKEPFATHPNKALSASANYDKPGTLTVHFEAYRSGNISEELSLETQEWTSINPFGVSFDEIVWIN